MTWEMSPQRSHVLTTRHRPERRPSRPVEITGTLRGVGRPRCQGLLSTFLGRFRAFYRVSADFQRTRRRNLGLIAHIHRQRNVWVPNSSSTAGDLGHRSVGTVGHDRRPWRYDCSISSSDSSWHGWDCWPVVPGQKTWRFWYYVTRSPCSGVRSGGRGCHGRIGRCSRH
jgi:hypothetical protein